jgi:RES domain-containing protein
VPITAWRIVKARHTANAFDGEGARVEGGRWNSPGTSDSNYLLNPHHPDFQAIRVMDPQPLEFDLRLLKA